MSQQTFSPRFLRPTVLLPFLLAIVALVYLPVLNADFLNFDDISFVTGNRMVRQGLTVEGVRYAFSATYGFWQPLTWLSHELDCHLYGMHPFGHHASNLLLHLSTTALCYGAFTALTRSPGCSLVVASMYALHPLHVESVAWIADRKGLIANLFWMLSLWSYARYARRQTVGSYLLVVAGFVGGMAAKPSLLTLPAALLVLDYWPLERIGGGPAFFVARAGGWRVVEKLPLMILAVGFAWWAYQAQQETGALQLITPPPLGVRLGLACVNYAGYLKHLLWPMGLACFYPHPGSTLDDAQTAKSVLALAAVTAVCVWQGRRRPYLLAGWLWYLITLIPMIGIIQVGAHGSADRYTDIPLLGAYWTLVFAAREICQRRPATRPLVTAIGVAVLTLWSLLSFRQARTWHDSQALFEHALACGYDAPLIRNNLGLALLDDRLPAEAEPHFRRALELDPRQSVAMTNLGLIRFEAGDFARAAEWFQKACDAQPNYSRAILNLAICRTLQKQPAEAEQLFKSAIHYDPQSPDARRTYGIFLAKAERPAEAVEQFLRCLKLEPHDREARYQLALAWNQLGKTDHSRRELIEILRLNPQWLPAVDLLKHLNTLQPRQSLKPFNGGSI